LSLCNNYSSTCAGRNAPGFDLFHFRHHVTIAMNGIFDQ
jgi:hypothetical protein